MAPSKPQANGEKKGKPSELEFNQKKYLIRLIFLQQGAGPRAL